MTWEQLGAAVGGAVGAWGIGACGAWVINSRRRRRLARLDRAWPLTSNGTQPPRHVAYWSEYDIPRSWAIVASNEEGEFIWCDHLERLWEQV